MLGFAATVTPGVVLPIAVLIHWMAQSQHSTLPAVASLQTATATTFIYCALGAAAVMILAEPVAFLAVHYPSRLSLVLHQSTFASRAVPAVIVAVSLVYLAINYLLALYETTWLVIAAYTVLFFALGLVCVHAEFGEIARSLHRGPIYVFARITLPLIGPGLIAGYCLVFVTATTERTTTLLLAPPGTKTLATQFWAFHEEGSYGAAAPYALVIIAVAVIPGALLGLWFDRRPPTTQPDADAAQSPAQPPTLHPQAAEALP